MSSTTTSRRPLAPDEAATYSEPNLTKRSRCSTTIVVTVGSVSRARDVRRLALRPEPISVTTRSIEWPFDVAPTLTRHLAIEVGSLVGRPHACVDDGVSAFRRCGFTIAHQNQPTHLTREHRQRSLSKPPIGGLGTYPLHVGPLTHVHYFIVLRRGVTSGGNPRFGLVAVDRTTFARTPKPSAAWYAEAVREARHRWA